MTGEIEFARLLNGPLGAALLVLVASYVLGCFNAGYYLVRWRRGHDIRQHGSGNAGATNVGRVLGRGGFMLVLLLDAAKGAAAIGLARSFAVDAWVTMLAGVAAVAGHIWPAQLSFRGGKGVATALGALLVFEPRLVLVLAALCLVALALTRRFTISGLIAFALAPLVWLFFRPTVESVVCATVLAVMLLLSHRKNLRRDSFRPRDAARIAVPISNDSAWPRPTTPAAAPNDVTP